MFRHIVVPLDSSTGAEHAIPIAARLAHVSGGKIVLVRVLSSPVDPGALETTSALAGRPDLFENPLTEGVRLTFLQTGWGRKMDRASKDDVHSVVRFRESWQEDRGAEEEREETVGAVAQRRRA